MMLWKWFWSENPFQFLRSMKFVSELERKWGEGDFLGTYLNFILHFSNIFNHIKFKAYYLFIWKKCSSNYRLNNERLIWAMKWIWMVDYMLSLIMCVFLVIMSNSWTRVLFFVLESGACMRSTRVSHNMYRPDCTTILHARLIYFS